MDYDRTPNSYYFNGIIKQMESLTYKSNFTREYTEKFMSSFQGFTCEGTDGKIIDVQTIYGSPERAVGKRNLKTSLVLPLMAFSVHSIKDAETRQKYEPLINFETHYDKTSQRAQRIVSRLPKPVTLNYTLSLYSKFMEDLNQLTESVELMFHPSFKLPVTFDAQAQAFIKDRQEATNVVIGDKQDRVLKRNFVISIETYIPSQRFLVTNTGRIEKFDTDLKIDEKL